MQSPEKQFQHLLSLCSAFHCHRAIIYCMLSFAVWLRPSYAMMCSLCLSAWEDASVYTTRVIFWGKSVRCSGLSCSSGSDVRNSAVACEPQLSLSELVSGWSWWHLSVSVTTQLAQVFQKQLGRLICLGPALPSKLLKLHWSGQTNTVLLKKLIQVHHLNSTGGETAIWSYLPNYAIAFLT